MATSGSISKSGSWATVTLSWNRTSVDVSKNTSTISYSLSIYRQYQLYSSASKKYSIVINGTTVASGTNTIGGIGTTTLKTGSVTIPHNSDGTKAFSYSFSQTIDATLSGTWVGTLSNSGSGTLDSIARTSKHTLNTYSQAIGSAITISTNRASTGFTHTVSYVFGTKSGIIGTGVTTSVAWTLPASLADAIPNATSGSGTIKCITYSGSTKVGEHSLNFTATVPNNSTYNPAIGSLTASEAGGVTIGAYVQAKSKIKWTMGSISAKYSATIKSYKLTFDGSTWTSSIITTGVLKGSGSLTAVATVTDSRGRTATRSTAVTVLAYTAPSITKLTVFRANSNGTSNEFGTHIRVDRSATVKSLVVGTEKNSLRYTIKTKERKASTWVTNVALTTNAGLSLTGGNTITPFDVTKSYDVRVEVVDVFNTTIALATISTGEVTMSWGRSGIGIGKIWESGALDVGGRVDVNGEGEGLRIMSPTHGYIGFHSNGKRDGYIGKSGASATFISVANEMNPTNGYFHLGDQNFNLRSSTATYNGVRVFTSDSPLLWSGGMYLSNTQTVIPSKKLSECPNGWILVWSSYIGGAVTTFDFNTTVIHKEYVERFSGRGAWHALQSNGNTTVYKYLYAHDSNIAGHSRNATAPENAMVLREVYSF